jgi:predicted  nucleic acid-binding Zn-ribbon protein
VSAGWHNEDMSNSEDERPKRNIDERIDAIAMNLELLTHDVSSLRTGIAELSENSKRDAENIRALTSNVTRLTSVVETLAGTVIGTNAA